MAINLLVTGKKYYNQFRNGILFDTNLGDFTANLVGNVSEKIKAIITFSISWSSIASVISRFTTSATQINRNTGSFLEDGFLIGDTFDYLDAGDSVEFSATITNMSEDGLDIFFNVSSGTPIVGEFTVVVIKGTTAVTRIKYGFGLIENDESFNILSKLVSRNQLYNVGIFGAGTSFVDGVPHAIFRDWVTGNMKARFVSNPDTYTQAFELEHEFILNPYFTVDQLSNIQASPIIPPVFLEATNSLRHAIKLELGTTSSASSKVKELPGFFGSVGFFDENFNGLTNNYKINSVIYEDVTTSESVTSLQVANKTKVTIVIEKLNGNFSSTQKIGFIVSKLPTEAEYTETITTFIDNFIYDNAYVSAPLSGIGESIIKDLTVNTPITNKITITAEVEYSAAQKLTLDSQSNYIIGINVEDESLTAPNSDRVVLRADTRTYKGVDQAVGLMDVTKFDIFKHNEEIGVDTGHTDFIGFNEDGIAIDFNFTLDLSKEAFLNTLDFQVIAFNTVTKKLFVLDTFNYNLSRAITSAGVQQIEFNLTRGYNLEDDSDFNKVFLTTGAKVGDLQNYNGIISVKIPYEDWLSNLNADNVFYDATKPNNNLNLKTSNYSGLNDYVIKLSFSANLDGLNVLGVQKNTDYRFLSPNILIFDYEKDGNATPKYTIDLKTFKADTLVDLDGNLLDGEDTLLKVTYTQVGGIPVVDIAEGYGIHRIENENNISKDIEEFSSITTPSIDVNNKLKPITGETLLKISIIAGNIVTESLVDGTRLTAGVNQKLSATINNIAVLLVDENGDYLVDENGDFLEDN